jgi:hypothetical protein
VRTGNKKRRTRSCHPTTRPPLKTAYIIPFVGAILLCSLATLAQAPTPECGGKTGVEFRIVTDKLVYPPKAVMRVKFLITNTDATPLHLIQALNDCTSPKGFFWLDILDKNNKTVPIPGCSADLLMDQLDAVETLSNPKTSLLLYMQEIYGYEGEYELPDKQGTYRLKAKLFTGDFNEQQQQALADKHMRVLPQHCFISAPIVVITVK